MTIKKSSTKTKDKKRSLVCANGMECFWTCDGKVLVNIVELRDALSSMADDVFKHHVTKDKNDFAEWIEHILLDRELGIAIRKAKKASTAKAAILSALKGYDL